MQNHNRWQDKKNNMNTQILRSCEKTDIIYATLQYKIHPSEQGLILYESEISSIEMLKSQFELWKLRFKKIAKKPSAAIEALAENFTFLPDIKVLLEIFSTRPVSTCSSEK